MGNFWLSDTGIRVLDKAGVRHGWAIGIPGWEDFMIQLQNVPTYEEQKNNLSDMYGNTYTVVSRQQWNPISFTSTNEFSFASLGQICEYHYNSGLKKMPLVVLYHYDNGILDQRWVLDGAFVQSFEFTDTHSSIAYAVTLRYDRAKYEEFL